MVSSDLYLYQNRLGFRMLMVGVSTCAGAVVWDGADERGNMS